jgi:two-component system, OmpR family, alkaline phosphatase synthesis response regulator PhoP
MSLENESKVIAPSQGQSPSHRVLLIDDHMALAEATAEFLRCEGMEVRAASNGREALEIAAAFQPEIVLCDLALPDMSGLDLATALQASPGGENAVIAMHSARSERELREIAVLSNASVNIFLSKPITREKLAALLSKLQTGNSGTSPELI